MRHFITIGILTSFYASLVGCNQTAEIEQVIGPKFSTDLTSKERELVIEDTSYLLNAQVQIPAHTPAAQVFGGTSSQSVLRYLDERVNYIYGAETLLERLPAVGSGPVLFATNIGVSLWLQQEAIRPQKLEISWNGQPLSVDSSRVGIVKLGKGYRGANVVPRVLTLIHEARHSDCTGGLSQADLTLVKAGKLPENRGCGNLHTICPAGHAYEGLYACDSHPWGAYTVDALFAKSLSENCVTCTPKEKALAKAAMIDSISRIPMWKEMMDGKHGAPDMTSQGVLSK